jgi:serine/threonine protein kinase
MYEVYDFCEHGDLSKIITEHLSDLNVVQGLFIFKNLVSAIQLLHQARIIHRDIKPENILLKTIKKSVLESDLSLKDSPELALQVRYSAVLADFGLCRILEDNEEEIAGSYGSPMYMSPECLSGQNYGLKNDLYSLGIVLYELMYSQVPYSCSSAEELITLIYN